MGFEANTIGVMCRESNLVAQARIFSFVALLKAGRQLIFTPQKCTASLPKQPVRLEIMVVFGKVQLSHSQCGASLIRINLAGYFGCLFFFSQKC